MEARTALDESVLPLGRKTRALLAILALSAPRPVMRSRLADLLWSRRPEEQSRASLRQEIHRLIEALTPAGHGILRVSREHLSLHSDRVWVDVDQVLRATECDPAPLGLLTGELLKEFDGVDPAFDQWLDTERERLRDAARTVAEGVLSGYTVPESVIPAARQLLEIDRVHEGAWRALMRAHAERGERGLAIQAFDRCRLTLSNALDAPPSAETARLAADIQSGVLATNRHLTPQPKVADTSGTPRRGAKIGVLPFRLLGTGAEEAHLSISLAEEITSALAQFRWLVLATSSSLAQVSNREAATLRRSFGMDFLLDGSVQRARDRLRVTINLLDLHQDGQLVWAERFDWDASDPLGLQDQVAAGATARIEGELLFLESRRAALCAGPECQAYQLVMQALPALMHLRRPELAEAGALLDRALALDPDYALAHAWRAFWTMLWVGQGWADEPGAAGAARHHAERAVTLDQRDARGLTIAGHVRAVLSGAPREALELHGRALSLNPNLAMAWGLSAIAHTYLGEVEEASRCLARYRRLVPADPHTFFFAAGAAALELVRGDWKAAVAAGRQATELNPHYAEAARHYLAALGHAGQQEEAARVRERLLAAEPGFSVAVFLARSPFKRAADRDAYAAGLRLAGVPEGANGL